MGNTCKLSILRGRYIHTYVCILFYVAIALKSISTNYPYRRSSSEYLSCHKLIIVPEFWFKMCIWLICTDSLAPGSAPRIKISSKTRFWRGNCCLDQNIKRMNIQPWIHYLCWIQILLKVKTYFSRFSGQKKSFQEFPIYDITSHLATRKLCQRLWKVFSFCVFREALM